MGDSIHNVQFDSRFQTQTADSQVPTLYKGISV